MPLIEALPSSESFADDLGPAAEAREAISSIGTVFPVWTRCRCIFLT